MDSPRFSIQIPNDILDDLLRDCEEEVRTQPQMVIKIVVDHYRRKKKNILLEKMKAEQFTEGLEGEPLESAPLFGPRPDREEAVTKPVPSEGEGRK